MGICGSKVEDVDEKGVETKDTHHDKTPTKPTKPTKDDRKETDEKEDASEVDFRETLKGVVLLILNRLVTALEYEQEGFLDLAVKRGKSNYMDLIAPQHFEKFLKETFDVESVTVSPPEVDASDSNYEQQRFMRLLEACEKAPFRSPAPTSEKFATSIQKIAKLTQKELRESAISSDSSDLKIHLFFFAKALDVVDGGIVDHHELLYTNIDDMCEPKS